MRASALTSTRRRKRLPGRTGPSPNPLRSISHGTGTTRPRGSGGPAWARSRRWNARGTEIAVRVPARRRARRRGLVRGARPAVGRLRARSASRTASSMTGGTPPRATPSARASRQARASSRHAGQAARWETTSPSGSRSGEAGSLPSSQGADGQPAGPGNPRRPAQSRSALSISPLRPVGFESWSSTASRATRPPVGWRAPPPGRSFIEQGPDLAEEAVLPNVEGVAGYAQEGRSLVGGDPVGVEKLEEEALPCRALRQGRPDLLRVLRRPGGSGRKRFRGRGIGPPAILRKAVRLATRVIRGEDGEVGAERPVPAVPPQRDLDMEAEVPEELGGLLLHLERSVGEPPVREDPA